MPDERSRPLGLAGLQVTCAFVTDDLDLEVEVVGREERCPHCGRRDLVIKERPVIGVRDLPPAAARRLWHKRRWRSRGSGRTHTEQYPVPPSRQRVSRRFRTRLGERAAMIGG
jgi:DNA-directed RNA polymerase subunit RPC12/RpoP